MLPSYQRLSGPKHVIQIPFPQATLLVGSIPVFSFIFCIIWSVLYFFEESTATHCSVRNYLPSISAAIGNYQPQRFVWQAAICLQLLPRLSFANLYVRFHSEITRADYQSLVYLVAIFDVIENIALLCLTLWTSIDNYEIHRASFTVFIIISELHMLSVCLLLKYGRKLQNLTRIEKISYLTKKNLFTLNILSFSAAIYFFFRHNRFCEPGVYTMFSLFEYLAVLSNMGFHMTAYWDFYGKNIVFDWYEGITYV